METVVGVFTSRENAQKAIEDLRAIGVAADRINLLTPGDSEAKLQSVRTTETEQPGMGETIGGVVGGALGAAGGLGLGAATASLFLPGVGPVMAMGLLGAAILGSGGAVGGAVAGHALEDAMEEGLPVDELFVYEDALRKGRSVVLVAAADDTQAEAARRSLNASGAESLDAAREDWWIGLRDAAEEEYGITGEDFRVDEALYRRGCEAAQHPKTRGKAYDEAINYLMARYPDQYQKRAFRRGYEHGLRYYRDLLERHSTALEPGGGVEATKRGAASKSSEGGAIK